MSLFIRKKLVNPLEELTPTRAMQVYGQLKIGKTANELFTKYACPFLWTETVWNEAKRIEAEIISKMSGTWILEAGIPAVYDELGELVTPAIPPVYFQATTASAMINSLESELLTIVTVLQDVGSWIDGDPENGIPTWVEFVALFEE